MLFYIKSTFIDIKWIFKQFIAGHKVITVHQQPQEWFTLTEIIIYADLFDCLSHVSFGHLFSKGSCCFWHLLGCLLCLFCKLCKRKKEIFCSKYGLSRVSPEFRSIPVYTFHWPHQREMNTSREVERCMDRCSTLPNRETPVNYIAELTSLPIACPFLAISVSDASL